MLSKQNRCTKVKKLSESMPHASRSEAVRALKSLLNSTKESAHAADLIETVLLELRQSIMQEQKISQNLKDNETFLRNVLDKSADIVFRKFQVGNQAGLLIFVDGLTNSELINSDILKPLIQYGNNLNQRGILEESNIKEILQNQVITSAQLSDGKTHGEVVKSILAGDVAILIDGMGQAIFTSMRAWDKRSVEEPQVEPVIRGPREGFTESLMTNISMVRRRLKTSTLKTELMQVGRLSQTDIIIIYLAGIADDALIEEVRKRISRIDIDAILESGNIEELIEDNPLSIFPQFAYTERPDKLVSSLLEGQIGIMVNNTPFALIAPQTFFK